MNIILFNPKINELIHIESGIFPVNSSLFKNSCYSCKEGIFYYYTTSDWLFKVALDNGFFKIGEL